VRVRERRDDGARGRTLVEIVIESGRPHQIRIHLACAGHPLVGEPFFARDGMWNEEPAARPGDAGYRLHAWRLELDHPVTNRAMEIECPPPSDLRTRPPLAPERFKETAA
jgi:23S rRNA pseudouridine1911/1915/1917 synthase